MDTHTATEHIVEALTKAILDHRLLPGAKLAEQKLADQFGVSRTLIRQALFQLNQNGLVRMEPARGAFVSTPSIEEAKQVFAVRRILEAELIRQFAAKATREDIKALENHLSVESEHIHAQPHAHNPATSTELLSDFHVHLAALSGNMVLAEILSSLISRCALITMMYQSPDSARCSNQEHQGILDALRQKDTEQAAHLMVQHLLQVEKGLSIHRAL